MGGSQKIKKKFIKHGVNSTCDKVYLKAKDFNLTRSGIPDREAVELYIPVTKWPGMDHKKNN